MPRLVVLEVDAAAEGQRLDVWLTAQLADVSRAQVQALVAGGHVNLAGQNPRASQRLRTGQRLEVSLPEPTPALPPPEDIPLTIVFEDSDLLVIDKPAGLTVHPGAGRVTGTLVNALLHHVRDLSGVGGVLRPGIVHRLDRGTSGLLVVAKHDAAHRALARQFAERLVAKEYRAVVLGVPRALRGAVTTAIGRDPVHRKRMAIGVPRARRAHTEYEVVAAVEAAALLAVRILTGRTHQIRVHLASLGHPLVGDTTYGTAQRALHAPQPLRDFPRPALHAARLAFAHPLTGEPLAFESPLPEDLRQLLTSLGLEGSTAAHGPGPI
jgi:23S rRNA pseudouridine1911/1915/1917 synthase